MRHSILMQYEGKAVCFFYKLKESEPPTRLGRGIIYEGKCYLLSSSLNNRKHFSIVSVEMQEIPAEDIAEFQKLEDSQKNLLEKTLEDAAAKKDLSRVQLKVRVAIKNPKSEKEKEEVSQKTYSWIQPSLPYYGFPQSASTLQIMQQVLRNNAAFCLPTTDKEWQEAWYKAYQTETIPGQTVKSPQRPSLN